jgi:hypothetical protein
LVQRLPGMPVVVDFLGRRFWIPYQCHYCDFVIRNWGPGVFWYDRRTGFFETVCSICYGNFLVHSAT